MTEGLAIYIAGAFFTLGSVGLGAFVWLLKAQQRMLSNHLKHDLDAMSRNTTALNKLAAMVDKQTAGTVEVTRTFTETLKDVRRDCVVRRGENLDG